MDHWKTTFVQTKRNKEQLSRFKPEMTLWYCFLLLLRSLSKNIVLILFRQFFRGFRSMPVDYKSDMPNESNHLIYFFGKPMFAVFHTKGTRRIYINVHRTCVHEPTGFYGNWIWTFHFFFNFFFLRQLVHTHTHSHSAYCFQCYFHLRFPLMLLTFLYLDIYAI